MVETATAPIQHPKRPLPQAANSLRSDLRIEIGVARGERRALLDWLDDGLRAGRRGRLESEYPLLFGAQMGDTEIPVTLRVGDEPAAFCLVWPRTVRFDSGELRTGLVSFVYTDPKWRGRGFARRVVRASIAEAKNRNVSLLMLWSDLPDLYAEIGFCQIGIENLMPIDQEMVRGALTRVPAFDSPIETGPMRAEDWHSIGPLRKAREAFVELSDLEFEALQSLPDMSVRVARTNAGLCAFAMQGRGDDFPAVIHDWGGAPAATLRCFEALLEEGTPLLLLAPASNDPVTWALRQSGGLRHPQPLAWMQIGSLSAFIEDLSKLLHEPLDFTSFPSPSRPNARAYSIRGSRGRLVLEEFELLSQLLGSLAPRSAASPHLSDLLADPSATSLPLPLFVWGLESI